MANMDYGASILRIVVAQMCETVGWNSIQTTPLQLLTDVLQRYITEVAENAHRYAEQFGHTQPTLHDLGLAFQDMKINTGDLQEYIEYVATIPLKREVPKYPINKDTHLNLLKPGSREVVTRPVHIHEHLPAMHPELENEDYGLKSSTLTVETNSTEVGSPSNPFKRPGDPVTSISPQMKQARLTNEEEGRPLREISSVMMTTSGFLSPAREGKLPEAHTPALPSKLATHSASSSGSSSYPTVPPEVGEKKTKKKSTKLFKKAANETKSKVSTDLVVEDDSKVKKLVGMKELSKLKALKSFKLSHSNPNSSLKKLPKIPKIKRSKVRGSKNTTIKEIKDQTPAKSQHLDSTDKTLIIKIDRMENEIDVCGNSEENDDLLVDDAEIKLTSEPDKQKLNIFKKISKVKEEKLDNSDYAMEEEPVSDVFPEKISKLEVIKPTEESYIKEPELPPSIEPLATPPASSNTVFSESGFDSPPGPPRTPEVIIPTKNNKSKKHKKNRTKVKKEKAVIPRKDQVTVIPKLESKPPEQEIIEKPKTPEIEPLKDIKFLPTPSPVFSFFENFSSGPGLIPPQISNLFTPKPKLDKHSALLPQPVIPTPKLSPVPHDSQPKECQPPPLLPPSPPQKQPTSSKEQIPSTPEVPKTVDLPKTEIVDKTPLFKVKLKEDKKKKEHRSDKKDKIKKKKHKKDKIKNKDDKDIIKKKDKSREKKEKRREERKREKEKESVPIESTSEATKPSTSGNVPKITLKLASEPPQVTSSEQSHRKIVIKPVKKPEEQENEVKKETFLESVKTPHATTQPAKLKSSKKSMLSTTAVTLQSSSIPIDSSSISTPNPSSSKPKKPPSSRSFTPKTKEPKKQSRDADKTEPQPYYYDDKGNQVWICPTCRGPDDGSPMIGCDSCDAWYHWVCVGLQLPPQSNDWFCKFCIVKKDTAASDKKKKFRKKLLAGKS